ncbi:MAG TPA: hypothetical protein VFQ61_05655 [Polyangiaceae bacterium]|nr:hypothetical protein [Polyangiaceae bacterium]
MLKLSSAWVLGWVAMGLVGVACTVVTDGDDDHTGGSSSSGGRGSGGRSSGGTTSSAEGGMAEAGETSTTGGRASTGGSSSGGRTSTGGRSSGGTTSSGEAGAGGGTDTPPVELFDCDLRSTTGAQLIDEDVSTNTTWSGTINIRRNLRVVEGATLTIEPGTHIVMGPDSMIEFGWNTNAATVKAVGTAEKPIRFCGEQGDPGFWSGISVGSNVTSNSQLSHVLISDAGADEAALTLASNIEITDVQIRNSEKDGVHAVDFSEGSAQLSVEGAQGTAVVATHADAIDRFPLGGTFSNNQNNLVALDFGSIETDVTFADVGIPYQHEGTLQIRKAKVVIDPGVTILMGADAFLDVGWNTNAGTLTAVGTPEAPIVFRGVEEQSGFWAGILIETNVTTNSSLSNLEIWHAGGNDQYALEVRSPINIDDVRLSDNDQGAFIGADGVSDDSKNLSITRTKKVALTVEPNGLIALPQGGDFTGNDTDEVQIQGGNFEVSGTIPNLGVPYRVLGDISTRKASMTLTAGTKFIMSADSGIEWGWNGNEATIIAVGTAAKPIQFVGADPVSGFWKGLTVGTNALSSSKFDYVEVSHGSTACLSLNSSVPVTHSSFSQCEWGILHKTGDARDYAATNTFTQTSKGTVGTL